MLPFTGNPLDRLSEKRTDTAWIEGKRWDPGSRVLPLWRLQVLVAGEQDLTAARLAPERAWPLAADAAAWVFLGLEGDTALFAADVGREDAAEILRPHGTFRELRGAAPLLDLGDLAILSQAKALLDWHTRHGFCARCGQPTTPGDAGYKRVCGACGSEHFPRTDPAVIMLATHGDHCLLARNVNWPPEAYSTLAGFVEPGETFEEAVKREAREEAGVDVTAVTYYASQPWPFPSSLMIGCFAECASMDLKLGASEIADAVWYTREEAKALLEGRIEGRRRPFPFAIAYHLIKTWVERG